MSCFLLAFLRGVTLKRGSEGGCQLSAVIMTNSFMQNKSTCHNNLFNLIYFLIFILQSIIIIILIFVLVLDWTIHHDYFESVHCYPPASKCPKQPNLKKSPSFSSLNVFLKSSYLTSMSDFTTNHPSNL